MKPFAVLVLLLAAGCFNPHYTDGNLQCAPGDRCPSGMQCFSGKCFFHEPVTGDGGNPGFDTGPDIVEVDVTPEVVRPLRGYLDPCTAVGSGAPDRTDDCEPDLVCVDANVGAKCLRRCPTGSECSGGSCENRQVDLQVAATLRVCGLLPTACDAIANSGCASGELCYLENGATICEITSGEGSNSSCVHSRECLPRYTCASRGPGVGRCYPTCLDSSTCPNATTCQSVAGELSYCF